MAKLYGDLTGDRFGKLTVIKRVDDIVSESGKTRSMAWLCKCDCGKEVVFRESTLKSKTKKIKSCGCSKETNPDYQQENIISEEMENWNKLYDYVCEKIMNYPKNSLTNNMIYRLRGMAQGKKIANSKNTNSEIIYPYNVVLNTFKFSMPQIKQALNTKSFYTDDLKFRYICSIAESNLNSVYKKMKDAELNKKYINSIVMPDIPDIVETKHEPEEKKVSKNKYDYLW